MRRSVELVMLPAVDLRLTAAFYEQLGFRAQPGGDDSEVVLERATMQLVLTRQESPEPDDGRPRLELLVTLDELERMWNHDDRDEPTLPGPTLAKEGMFEYRARDPSGNRVRLLAPLPDPGAR